MTITDLIPLLEKAGWREFKDSLKNADRCFYKAFPAHEQCRCNDGKNKQVEVYLYEWMDRPSTAPSCTIEVHGDMQDNDWIKLSRHCIVDPDVETIESIAESLLKTWDFAVHQHNQTL